MVVPIATDLRGQIGLKAFFFLGFGIRVSRAVFHLAGKTPLSHIPSNSLRMKTLGHLVMRTLVTSGGIPSILSAASGTSISTFLHRNLVRSSCIYRSGGESFLADLVANDFVWKAPGVFSDHIAKVLPFRSLALANLSLVYFPYFRIFVMYPFRFDCLRCRELIVTLMNAS